MGGEMAQACLPSQNEYLTPVLRTLFTFYCYDKYHYQKNFYQLSNHKHKELFTRKLRALISCISGTNSNLDVLQGSVAASDAHDISMSDTKVGYISEETGKEDNSSHPLLETIHHKIDCQGNSINVYFNWIEKNLAMEKGTRCHQSSSRDQRKRGQV